MLWEMTENGPMQDLVLTKIEDTQIFLNIAKRIAPIQEAYGALLIRQAKKRKSR